MFRLVPLPLHLSPSASFCEICGQLRIPFRVLRACGSEQDLNHRDTEMVGIIAAGSFAFAIAFGTQRIDGINGAVQLQQLINGRPLGGLNGYGQAGIRFDLLPKLLPAGQGVREKA